MCCVTVQICSRRGGIPLVNWNSLLGSFTVHESSGQNVGCIDSLHFRIWLLTFNHFEPISILLFAVQRWNDDTRFIGLQDYLCLDTNNFLRNDFLNNTNFLKAITILEIWKTFLTLFIPELMNRWFPEKKHQLSWLPNETITETRFHLFV